MKGGDFSPVCHRVRGENRIDQSGGFRLFGREPLTVAVIAVHEFGEMLLRHAGPFGINPCDSFVGFVQHPGSFPERVGISFGVAGRPVDQIEAVGGHFPFARRCSLGDQRGGRCGVSVTARGDFTIEVPQCVVDQQGVVHIPAR